MENTDRAQDALQLEALLLSRTYLYTLFNKLFGGEPDGALLETLFDGMTFDVLDEFGAASDKLTAFGTLLATKRDEWAAGKEAFLDRARDEYTRVFIGPAALPASPYESPYTGAHDMATFQENTLAVRALYHEQGLRVRREQAVPDDHAALMCAFAAEMSRRALAALVGGDYAALAQVLRTQGAFATEHLANWLGVYAQSVRNSKAGAEAVLYPQLIEALDALSRADTAFLAESAYWAEGVSEGNAGIVAAACPGSPELADARAALERLEALRPFGIQDNELVPVS